MIKSIALLVRKDGTTREEFMQWLVQQHAPAAKALPGVRGYIVHEIVREMTRPDIPVLNIGSPIDSIVEIWADDAAALERLQQSVEYQRWAAAELSHVGRMHAFTAQEDIIIPMPATRPGIKTIAFLNRKPGEQLDVFRHHWHVGHGGMARVVPYLKAFILNDILSTQVREGIATIEFDAADGFATGWLDSPEAQQAMIQTPQAREWFADGSKTFGQIKSFLVREIVIVDPVHQHQVASSRS
jgi:quinol monooxygenase YgiN